MVELGVISERSRLRDGARRMGPISLWKLAGGGGGMQTGVVRRPDWSVELRQRSKGV